jgi:hypothetical protein
MNAILWRFPMWTHRIIAHVMGYVQIRYIHPDQSVNYRWSRIWYHLGRQSCKIEIILVGDIMYLNGDPYD